MGKTALQEITPTERVGDSSPNHGRKTKSGISSLALVMSLLMGIYFGIVLTKSEVVRWQRVHDMFLFKEAHMYLIIGVGIVVAMVSMLLIKSLRIRTIEGAPIKYEPKPFHKGVIIGGILFGAGWAITGACPGPIYAQIGSGAWMAMFTFAGAVAGMYIYALLKPSLPH
jgi:hypothetical protein